MPSSEPGASSRLRREINFWPVRGRQLEGALNRPRSLIRIIAVSFFKMFTIEIFPFISLVFMLQNIFHWIFLQKKEYDAI